MGQRHQAFVIARVQPHGAAKGETKYRCIAAFHHQWSYGRLPLQAVHRFLTLVKQKDNAQIVRAEIQSIQGKYGRYRTKPQMPQAPCPFIAYLLASSWNIGGLADGDTYMSGITFTHSLLHADMGSWGGDNNDGISIIDVTDPDGPAYCFLRSRRPLSATDYVRGYYSKPSEQAMEDPKARAFEENILASIRVLDGVEMITLEMLAEAWPHEYSQQLKKAQEASEPETGGEVSPGSADTTSILPSLASLSMGSALSHAIVGGDTGELENVLWLPGKADEVKAFLRDQSPFPDNTITLLLKVFSEQQDKLSLDLSSFDMSAEQILKIVATKETIRSLDLSYNVRITASDISDILAMLPNLQRLTLMGCTSVTDADLFALLRSEPQLFYRLDALMHPALLQVTEPPQYPISFTFAASFGASVPLIRGCSLPLFIPTRILKSFADFLKVVRKDPVSYNLSGGMAAQSIFTAIRSPGQAWEERSVVAVPVLDTDVFGGQQPGWALIFDYGLYRPSGVKYAFLRFRPERAFKKPAEGDAKGGDKQTSWETGTPTETISPEEDNGITEPNAAGMDSQGASEPAPTSDDKTQQAFPYPYDILDVEGFLRATEEEGRPSVSPQVVERLREAFEDNSVNAHGNDGEDAEGSQLAVTIFAMISSVTNGTNMPRRDSRPPHTIPRLMTDDDIVEFNLDVSRHTGLQKRFQRRG